MTMQADHAYAIRFREAVKGIVTEVVNNLRPPSRFATVVSLDPVNFQAEVQFPAEPTTTSVAMTGVQPEAAGGTVLVSGQGGNLFISDVMGPVLLDGGGGTPGVTDHGALIGLEDDDHPQYAPKASPTFTGQVKVPPGTAGAPGLAFSDETDTGFQRFTFGGNFMDWVIDGAMRIRTGGPTTQATVIAGTGEATLADQTGLLQLGVGAAPNLGLDANEIQARAGAGVAAALYLNPLGGNVEISSTLNLGVTGSAGSKLILPYDGSQFGNGLQMLGSDGNPLMWLHAVGGNSAYFRLKGLASGFTFADVAGRTAMRILDGGAVGMGTASPAGVFHCLPTSSGARGFVVESNVGQSNPTFIVGDSGQVTRISMLDNEIKLYNLNSGYFSQAANSEYLLIKPVSNIYRWDSLATGTGTPRGFQWSVNGTQLMGLDTAGKLTLSSAPTAGTHVPNRDAGDARWLQIANFIAIPNDNAAPDTPTGLTAIPSFDQVLVKWNEAIAANDPDMVNGYGWYQVQIDTDSGFASPDQTVMTDGTATMIHGLLTGTTYYVRVKAIDAHGQQSGFTSGVSVTTIPIDPSVINIDSLIADGFLRSSDYNGTGFAPNDATLGWNIDDDGIETKALRARGTIEALGPQLLSNPKFDANITGWGADIAGKTWQFLTDIESWVTWSTSVVSWTNDVEKVLESGALQVKAGASPTSGYTGATSPTDTGLTVGAQFIATVTVKSTLSSTGPIAMFVRVVFKNSGGATVSTVDSPWQAVTEGEWIEVHSDLLTVPATVDRYTVSIFAKRADTTTALTVGDTFSVGLVGAQKPSVTTVSWDNTKNATGSGGCLKGVPTATGAQVVHVPGGTDPTTGLTVKAGDLLYFSFKYQTQETAWPYYYVLPVFFFYGVGGTFVGMIIGEFLQQGNATTWTPGYAVTRVPANAVQVRAGIGWLSTGGSKAVWIDDASLAVPSTVSGAVLATGPTGFPRAEMRSGGRTTADSTPRVLLHGSGLEYQYDPGEFSGDVNPIKWDHEMQRPWAQVLSPSDHTNWPRQAGLQLFPGKVGANYSPVYAFDAMPLSARSTKNGGASNTAIWNNQTNWNQSWSLIPGIFVNATGVFTTPSWATGLWWFYAKIEWLAEAGPASGRRGIRFNGSKGAIRLYMGPPAASTDTTEMSVHHFARMAAGDNIWVESVQTTGANLGYGDNIFQAVYLGGYSGSDV